MQLYGKGLENIANELDCPDLHLELKEVYLGTLVILTNTVQNLKNLKAQFGPTILMAKHLQTMCLSLLMSKDMKFFGPSCSSDEKQFFISRKLMLIAQILIQNKYIIQYRNSSTTVMTELLSLASTQLQSKVDPRIHTDLWKAILKILTDNVRVISQESEVLRSTEGITTLLNESVHRCLSEVTIPGCEQYSQQFIYCIIFQVESVTEDRLKITEFYIKVWIKFCQLFQGKCINYNGAIGNVEYCERYAC